MNYNIDETPVDIKVDLLPTFECGDCGVLFIPVYANQEKPDECFKCGSDNIIPFRIEKSEAN